MIATTVDAFGRRADWFGAVFGSMWFVAFDTFGGFSAEVGGIAKGLAIKALSYQSGVLEFLPRYETMTKGTNL